MPQQITRTFPDGDYPTRLEQAYQAYQAAYQAEQSGTEGPRLLSDAAPVVVLAEEYRALKAEADVDAAAKSRVVTLQALGRREWRTLREKHPPRAGEDVDADVAKGDRLAGVNTETVEDDLVAASVIFPEFTSRAAFDEWSDNLSQGEWSVLVQDAWRLVNVAQFDPKSLPPSAIPSGAES